MAARLRRLPIATRMLVSALIMVLLVLPAAGGLLSWNFREAVNAAFDKRLESLLNVVLAGVSYDPRTDALVVSRALGDSRFDIVFSGWYWQVRDDGERVLASRSLWDQRLAVSQRRGLTFRTMTGPREQSLRVLERDIRLPNLSDALHVQVAADLIEVEAQIASFQTLLWLSLATLGQLAGRVDCVANPLGPGAFATGRKKPESGRTGAAGVGRNRSAERIGASCRGH